MKIDKLNSQENSKMVTINIDVQKVLATSRAGIGPLYYLSKLNVWNFTIFDLAKHIGTCHVWNETIGYRGRNEISSFVWEFFKEQSQEGVTDFMIYSDSCSGQNKNRIIFSMYMKAASEMNIKIRHRFVKFFLIFFFFM